MMEKKPIIKILCAMTLGAILGSFTFSVGTVGVCRPLIALGQGIRELSLSGTPGNLVAWILTVGLSLLPMLCFLRKNRAYGKGDLLLPLASLEIFAMIYFLINPMELSSRLLWMGRDGIGSLWALTSLGVIIATFVAWLLITYLDRVEGKAENLFPKLLTLCSIVLAFTGVFRGVQEFLSEIVAVQEGNTELRTVDTAVILKSVMLMIRLIPTVLSCRVLLWGRDLVCAVGRDPFGEETLSMAETITACCKTVAKVSVFCTLAVNIIQLLFLPHLADVRVKIELPLVTLALCGGMYFLCGYFRRAKAVNDDNESII